MKVVVKGGFKESVTISGLCLALVGSTAVMSVSDWLRLPWNVSEARPPEG